MRLFTILAIVAAAGSLLLKAEDAGRSLTGVIPAGCLAPDGTKVNADAPGTHYWASIRNRKFEFFRMKVLDHPTQYKISIESGQGLRFKQDSEGFVKALVNAYQAGSVLTEPCIITAELRRGRFSSYQIAVNGGGFPMPAPAPNPAPAGAGGYAIRLTDSGKTRSLVPSMVARVSATVIMVETGKASEITRRVDRITGGAGGSGSLAFDPARMPAATGQSRFVIAFERSGYDPEVRTVLRLEELVGKTIRLQRTDVDGRTNEFAVNAGDPALGGATPGSLVEHLPLPGNRSVDGLALLHPGVVPAPKSGTPNGPGIGPTIGTAGEVAVNGVRPRLNNFVIDGADNNDEAVGVRRQGFVFAGPYTIESIREFQLVAGLYDARFGRASGGQFNLLTRTGSQVWHGNFYGYLSDARFGSRDYFNADYSRAPAGAGYVLDGLRRQDRFGGNAKDPRTGASTGFLIGAPIGAKTQLTLSAEWRESHGEQTSHFAVPGVDQRAGSVLFSLFPFPNNPAGPFGASTFSAALPSNEHGLLYLAKLERTVYRGSRQHRISGTYAATTEHSTLPVTGGALYSELSPNVHTNSGTVFVDSNLSPTAANGFRFAVGEVRFTFARPLDALLIPSAIVTLGAAFLLNRPLLAPAARGGADLPAFGSTGRTTESVTGAAGQLLVAGYSGLGADVFRFPQQRRDSTVQLSDTVTWSARGWVFDAGVDFWHFRYDDALRANANPYLQFNGGSPFLPGGSAVDAVAQGRPAEQLQTLATTDQPELVLSRNQLDLFVNATRRLGRGLSLSASARVEFNRLPSSADGRFESAFDQGRFNQQIASGVAACQANTALTDLNRQVCANRVNFLGRTFVGNYDSIFAASRVTVDPRVGLAWSPASDNNTVVRAGFGRYTSQFPAVLLDESRSVFPQYFTVNYASLGKGVQVLPAGNLLGPEAADPVAFLTSRFQNATILNTRPADHLRNPFVYQYGLTVERAIRKSAVVSAAYVATTGHHLLWRQSPEPSGQAFGTFSSGGNTVYVNGNSCFSAGAPGVTSPGGSGGFNNAVSFPCNFVANQLLDTGASSTYQSLQAEVRGHVRRTQFGSAVTWGHAIDNASDFFDTRSGYALRGADPNSRRGSADFDVRLRSVSHWDWQPVAAGSLGTRWGNVLWSGWRLSGIFTVQSGMPFTVNSAYDLNGDGVLNDGISATAPVAASTGDRRVSLSVPASTTNAALYPAITVNICVVQGCALTRQIGPAAGRNAFRGPGLQTVDLSLSRGIWLADRQLTLRLDGFNVTNTPQFGMPQRLAGGPGFGASYDTVSPNRRLQMSVHFSF